MASSYETFIDRSAFESFADKADSMAAANGRFNINSFRSEINKGILQSNRYLVVLSPFNAGSRTTQPLSKFITDSASSLVLRCEAAMLPAVRLNTDDNIRRYGYGPVERVPHSVQFNEFMLTWMVDPKGKLVAFFNNWLHTIVNYQSKGGNAMSVPRANGKVPFAPYEVGYKDEYSCPLMSIFVYNTENDRVIEYKMYDVFPVGINDMSLAYGEGDTPLKFSVSFAFTDYEIMTPLSLIESGVTEVLRQAGGTAGESKVVTGATTPNVDRIPPTQTIIRNSVITPFVDDQY